MKRPRRYTPDHRQTAIRRTLEDGAAVASRQAPAKRKVARVYTPSQKARALERAAAIGASRRPRPHRRHHLGARNQPQTTARQSAWLRATRVWSI